jgi:hypothetical protein
MGSRRRFLFRRRPVEGRWATVRCSRGADHWLAVDPQAEHHLQQMIRVPEEDASYLISARSSNALAAGQNPGTVENKHRLPAVAAAGGHTVSLEPFGQRRRSPKSPLRQPRKAARSEQMQKLRPWKRMGP